MKPSIYIFTTLLLIITNTIVLHAQRTITGRILDIETKKPVSNVNLIIKGTTKGTVTNHLGFFQLDLQSTDTVLIASHVAFEVAELIIPEQDKFLSHLSPRAAVLTFDISDFTDEKKYEIKEEEPYDPSASLELPARFKGGEQGMFNYFGENLKPRDSSMRGVVSATFNVDAKGQTGKIFTEGDTIGGIGDQLKHLIEQMPAWMPAAQRGIPVEQRFLVYIKFGNQVYLVIEQPATFPGGLEKFYNCIMKSLKYPPEARQRNIQGKVFVEFVITNTGKIDPKSVKVIKGLGYGLDQEAIRVIKGCPDWIPGTQRGQPVAQKMVMPISFGLR